MDDHDHLRAMGKDWLNQMAKALDDAPRTSQSREDTPEGTVKVVMSDTLAKQMADRMRDIAKIIKLPNPA